MRGLMTTAAAVLMACVAAQAQAQSPRLVVSPHLGLYMPIGVRVDRYDDTGSLSVRKRQLTSLVAGARARAMGQVFGIEGSIGYSPSWVAVSQDQRTVDIDSNVILGSVRGVAKINGDVGPGRWAFEAVAGLGVVSRSGPAWDRRDPRVSGGVVLGMASILGVYGLPVALRLGIDDYMSSVQNGTDHPRPFAERIHHNIVWSFGITVPIGDEQ